MAPAIVLAAALLCAAPASAAPGSISGKVTAASGGNPVEGAYVCVLNAASQASEECAFTTAGGEYTIPGLEPGEYKVHFEPGYSSGGLIGQYYDEASSFATATVIELAGGEERTGIDAALAEGGKISGTVTAAASGEPLEGISVCAEEIGSWSYHCQATDSSGEYTIDSMREESA